MIYIITFILSSLILYYSERTKNKYTKNLYVVFAILVPSILAGLRDYSVGADVLNYGNIWFHRSHSAQQLIPFLESANRQSIGVGYALLNFIVSRFTDNCHWFYFVLAIVEISLLYYGVRQVKKNSSVVLCFLVYFFFYYNESYNNLRQLVALLIVLNSYRFIVDRKIVKFLLVIIIASTFHITAIIGLILYPLSILSENKLRKYYYWLIGAGLMGLVVGFSDIASLLAARGIIAGDRFSVYTEGKGVTGGRIIRIVFFVLIFALFTYKKKKIEKRQPFINTLYVYCIFSLGLTALLLLYTNSYIIRVAYYFDIFMILYVPILVKFLRIKIGNNKALTQGSVLVLYYFTYWLIVYVIRNGAGTIPYRFM